MEVSAMAGDDGTAAGKANWESYKNKPVTESNFHAVCDLLQVIGRTNIDLSYHILSEYVPRVRATGNRA